MLNERHIDRHNAILRILRSGVVRRQSELAHLLREDGFEVTQSSVCRDLRDLEGEWPLPAPGGQQRTAQR
jgi:arginine repressor